MNLLKEKESIGKTMRPQLSYIESDGSLMGQKVEMTVDENSLKHLMSVLSDLYSDIKTAIVRESLTNAIDSHITAGQNKAVEITTPTTLSPQLIIRDYGLGLSKNDIIQVVSKYGASTKRDCDKQAGTLGLGFKAPLAYGGKTFIVDSVKDGVRTQVCAYLDGDLTAAMEIVDEAPTSDPNGVTITVPVNNRGDHRSFEEAALKFQRYARYPVKVNGKQYSPEPGEQYVGDNFRLIPTSGYNGGADVFVMGNVAYRIEPDGNRLNLDPNNHVIIYVEMGEIDFTPSREDLNYTKRTKDAIEKYSRLYLKDKSENDQKRIDKAETYADAYILRNNILWEYRFDLRQYLSFTYKGEEIPQDVYIDGRSATIERAEEPKKWSCKSWDVNFSPILEKPNVGRKTIVLNYTNKTFNRFHADKIQSYCEENDVNFNGLVFLSDEVEAEILKWYNYCTILDWNDIKVTKTNLAKTAKKKKEEITWEGTGGENAGVMRWFVPDRTKNIWYVSKQAHATGRYFDYGDFRNEGDKDNQIFLVIPSRQPEFKKIYPNADHIKNLYVQRIKNYLDGLIDQDKLELSSYTKYNRVSIPMDPSKVLDPELRALLTGSASDELYQEYEKYLRLTNRLEWDERKKYLDLFPPVGNEQSKIRERYPLLPKYDRVDAEHCLTYVNAIYTDLINKGEIK